MTKIYNVWAKKVQKNYVWRHWRLMKRFHCYWLIYFSYSVSYNTRGAFVVIFFIWSDLLNCLRSVGTIGFNNRNWLKQPQSRFHWAIPHKSHHFSLLWCILRTANPNISSSTKISTIRPMFPDSLFVSYDYSARNIYEYFHLL